MKVTIPTLEIIVKKNISFGYSVPPKIITFTDTFNDALQQSTFPSFIRLNLLGKTIILKHSLSKEFYISPQYKIQEKMFSRLFDCPHDLSIPIMIGSRELRIISKDVIKVGCVRINKTKQHEIFKFFANHLGYELSE